MQGTDGIIESAQKVVVYGPEGIGKSTFAMHFPRAKFCDTEGSTKKLPVSRTPKPSSWTMILEQVRYYIRNPHEIGTFIIDTGDWAEKLCVRELCATKKKDGIEDFGYGKGYTYASEEFGKLLNLLEELVERGVNVVITAHAQMRKFEQPDEMPSYDRWEMKMTKQVSPMVREWADMVLFANYKTYVVKAEDKDKKGKAQGGKRVMHTCHHPCWDAKNRDNLKEELPFDFSEIQHCIPDINADKKQNIAPPSAPPVQAVVNPGTPMEAQQATVTAPPTPLTPTTTEPPKADPPKVEPTPNDLSVVPKPLADLMGPNAVTVQEIQQVVASRGYYPENTPIENYDPDFISGVLVGAWPQVFQMIQAIRENTPF